ncbi:hypothetical protein E2562_026388 [Oryza meyeriana var. granulata]|uniref:Uncharacterized protein n=1 Tax=Oryza meyeriana var. granulata TaxID=110450 RepID=A0A6G1DND2_9ORYZ|nr:hypothetical protein E2562_026388 [Oryza meyeriana var. granulata]
MSIHFVTPDASILSFPLGASVLSPFVLSVLIVVGASFLFSNLLRSPMAIVTNAAVAVPR